MKFPLSWLKEYIPLTQPSIEIARLLTTAGIEVDAVLKEDVPYSGIVVGRVKHVEKHPNADKLCVATVTDGTNDFQVVCGAPNCREGLKTAFARLGATLLDEEGKIFKIKNTKIRGVESFGMLCSAKELRQGDAHEGIVEFPQDYQEGTDLVDLFADPIFEVSITPNLGHCSSVMGIARDLSAVTGIKFDFKQPLVKENLSESIHKSMKVTILDKENCPRYTCSVIKNVKVGPSPEWLKKRLEAAGFRSVNNVVDITNYVLLDTGHPLHAFDYDQLAGNEIIVRTAKEGEKFVTLDGKERALNAESLLICDKERPVALAGIMGGLNSEVSDKTVNVLLESAYFKPTNIRRTSKRLGLLTDASKHFERGADPNNLIFALEKATMMIQELAGGQVATGYIDIKEKEFPKKEIVCRVKRVNDVLGTNFGLSDIEAIFQKLQFSPVAQGQESLTVKVPTYRSDISGEIDLVEEVARIYGYDNIERKPAYFQVSHLSHAPIFVFEREMRSRLMAEGLQEFLTCDLIGPSQVDLVADKAIPRESVIQVLNPTSIEQSILRPSLLPGLVQVIKYNLDHQNQNLWGFEIGKIHYKNDDQYKEQSVAGIVLTGKCRPHHWHDKPQETDFFDLKGIVVDVLKGLGIENARFKENAITTFHPGRQAAIFVGTLAIGSLGEVHPAVRRALDIPQRIFYAEINLHDLYQVRPDDKKMTELAIYPASERDWTITLLEEVSVQRVFDIIQQISSPILEEVTLVDIYRSDKLGKERKNATFHFVYRDRQKTVAQESVDAEHERVTGQVLNTLGKVVI